MAASDHADYCAFTKAVEHLGDRWSLLIVRELFMRGPQGFNQLAGDIPGGISRSVLAARLRKLEALGLVARRGPDRHAPYRLAPAGEQLIPTLKSLWQWAEHWVPEDPAMAQRDPSVIAWWLTNRTDPRRLPDRPAVIDFAPFSPDGEHLWLLVARGAEPSLCLEDPLLDPDRYVYVEADADGLLPISRGLQTWSEAIQRRTVTLYGDPDLVREMPSWFVDTQERRAAIA